jgi:hypothetical protein
MIDLDYTTANLPEHSTRKTVRIGAVCFALFAKSFAIKRTDKQNRKDRRARRKVSQRTASAPGFLDGKEVQAVGWTRLK